MTGNSAAVNLSFFLQTGLAKNREILKQDALYDMDMLLTPEQSDALFPKNDKRKKRAAIKRTLWTDGVVPYSFASNTFSQSDKTQIFAAMT